MNELEFTVSDIKDLMEAFRKNNLGAMEISKGDFSIKLEGAKTVFEAQAAFPAQAPAIAVAQDTASPAAIAGNIVASPIVGTFYASPAPGKEAYVSVGSKVKKGDVLFIIESMKLMNEVISEFDGVVADIFVENESPVEYGQNILTIV